MNALKSKVRVLKGLEERFAKSAQIRRNVAAGAENAVSNIVLREHKAFCKREKDVVFALYVSGDPFFPDVLRCVAAPGARFPAAASHFLSCPNEKFLANYEPLKDGIEFATIEDAEADELREPNSELAFQLIERVDPIFGDFVIRENIKSRIRFFFRSKSKIDAILTVNFRNKKSDVHLNSAANELASVFEEITEAVPCLADSYCNNRPCYFPIFVAIRNSIQKVTFSHWSGRSSAITDTLIDVLDKLSNTFGFDSETKKRTGNVYCTLFLQNTSEQLSLAAKSSNLAKPIQNHFSLRNGEGVISWVAIREKAVRIVDFMDERNKQFRNMHISFFNAREAGSQIAIPLRILGNSSTFPNGVLGVLSLESSEPNAFDVESTGFLSAIADELSLLILTHNISGFCSNRKSIDSSTRCATPHFSRECGMALDNSRLSILKSRALVGLYRPGNDFLEKLGDSLSAATASEFTGSEAIAHPLQTQLDELVWSWVEGADPTQTVKSLQALRDEIREVMKAAFSMVENRSALLEIDRSARAVMEHCVYLSPDCLDFRDGARDR